MTCVCGTAEVRPYYNGLCEDCWVAKHSTVKIPRPTVEMFVRERLETPRKISSPIMRDYACGSQSQRVRHRSEE